MGTRFIASHEAQAHEDYKKAIVEIDSSQTAVTRSYSGKPMRVIRNTWVDDWESQPEELMPFPEQMQYSARAGVLLFATRGAEVLDRERACLPCGQGAGGIRDIPSCAEIVDRIIREALLTIGQLGELAKPSDETRSG